MTFTTPDDNIYRQEIEQIKKACYSIKILYRYMDVTGCILSLKNSNLLFNHPATFNDPFDCHNNIIDFSNLTDQYCTYILNKHFSLHNDDEKQQKIQELKNGNIHLSGQEMLKFHRICCFTSAFNNLLMWAHYTEKHQGCCLAFDLKNLLGSISQKYSSVGLYPIDYKTEFPTINYYEQPLRALTSWQILKSKDWAYEKEIRAIIVDRFTNTDPLLIPINAKSFKAIYLGCKIDPEKKKKIIDICSQKYPHMKIYQMTLAENKFELHPVLVEINK